MNEELPELKKPVEEGAPAWVVTFGDLMSLLLCFFVLMLSFSQMDRLKYREVAGSLAKAFGVQRKVRAFMIPKGATMVAREFDQELIPLNTSDEFISMQSQESIGEELKRELAVNFSDMSDLVEVTMEDGQTVIRMMGETAFDSGQAIIRQRMKPLLEKVATLLKDRLGDIVIAGHTDNVPIRNHRFHSNLELALARSAQVANFLKETGHVRPEQIVTMGFAEHRPIASNDTEVGRQKNRRVEIIVTRVPYHNNADRRPPVQKADPVVEPDISRQKAGPVVEPDMSRQKADPVVEPDMSRQKAGPVVEPDMSRQKADPVVEPDMSRQKADPVVEPDLSKQKAEPMVEPDISKTIIKRQGTGFLSE